MEDVAWLFGADLAGKNSNSSELRCSDVWEVPPPDRCTFALTVSDCRSGDALLDYVELLYCRWDSLPIPPLMPLIGLFLLCVGLVCALAGGFVSPALVLLKDRFRLDEAKAGATLLTVGNGLPDIMGAIAAVNMGHEGLVVGEVLGGTLFVVGVIVGALYTVGGRAPLGRAFGGMLAFFAAAVLYVGHIYVTGSVTAVHIAIGAGIYVAHYVYIFSIPAENERRGRIIDNTIGVGAPLPKDNINNNNNNNDNNQANQEAPLPKTNVSNEKSQLPKASTICLAGQTSERTPLLKVETTIQKIPLLTTNKIMYVGLRDDERDRSRPWTMIFSLCTGTFACLETLYEVLAYCFQLPFSAVVPTAIHACTDIDDDFSLPSSAVSVPSSSSSSLFLSSGSSSFVSDCGTHAWLDWNQPRFALYPWLFIAASGLTSASDTVLFALLGLLSLLIYRTLRCILPRRTTDTLTTFAGFILSLCFLHRLTSELVAVVRAMGLCTQLTDEVMGLSILTYGNFVGDISTYIAIVNRGCLQMALTGCISSALMALLFNISLAFSMRLANEGVWLCPLTRSTVTTVLMGAVALCPVLLALFAMASKCHSSRTSGVCLLFYYAGIMILLVYTQL